MAWMFLVTTLAGGFAEGYTPLVRTHLTQAIDEDDAIIYVSSTEGFRKPGVIDIGGERIAYSSTTATTFRGSLIQPLVRGAEDTDAVAHASGAQATTVEGSLVNTAVNYQVAVLADASGVLGFVSILITSLRLLGNFLILPLQFLGTDLQILAFFWAVFAIGTIVAIVISAIGGRRVG